MDKLRMSTPNGVKENVEKLKSLFPDCVSESYNKMGGGKIKEVIDFDKLRQLLSEEIVEGSDERYQFTWPDKKKAVLLANSPVNATLRPCREESVDFDNTQNLYIEGDNLDVLKCLKETYLHKVKMIYIDPPYNTGNDFVYEDDFASSIEEYRTMSGQYDEDNNRLFTNSESNGRFHTDWLNMIYPRLKVARDLLTDDGVIFISIDDNEVRNLRIVCDEIFGESNFVAQLGWQKVYSPKNQAKHFSNDYEFILCFCRNIEHFSLGMLPRTEEMNARYKNPDNDLRGDWKPGDCVGNGERKNGYYDVFSPITGKCFNVPKGKHWVYAPDTMKRLLEDNRIYFGKDGNAFPAIKQFLSDVTGRRPSNLLKYEDYGHTDMAKKELISIFSDLEQVPFDTPKPTKLIKMLSIIGSQNNSLILDFFSGSATTAHAVMQLNAEDGGNRKFILVQLPELTDEKSEAYKAGYNNICEIGKERIRRAGKKILEEQKAKQGEKGLFSEQDKAKKLDTGFRVLKLDSTNMQDIYYSPADTNQADLFSMVDNVKPDRSPEDLLFQVMLELGATLDSKIERMTIESKSVFNVADNFIVACFDKDVSDKVVTAIAKKQPPYAVIRDTSMVDDSTATNFEQIFKTYSPNTTIKIL